MKPASPSVPRQTSHSSSRPPIVETAKQTPARRHTKAVIPNTAPARIEDDFATYAGSDDDALPEDPTTKAPSRTAPARHPVAVTSQGDEESDSLLTRKQVHHYTAENVAAITMTQDHYKNKENRPLPTQNKGPTRRHFIDPQENAHRVQFDENSQVAGEPQTRKRPIESADEDITPSEDEGFEQDKRATNLSRRLVHQPHPPRAETPSKRHRPQNSSKGSRFSPEDIDVRLRQEANEQLQASAQRASRGSDLDDDDPVAPAISYAEVRRAASQVPTRVAPLMQSRVPWDTTETEYLIGLIEQYGNKWSIIAKIGTGSGGLRPKRTDVNCKDKARNIKIDFLK